MEKALEGEAPGLHLGEPPHIIVLGNSCLFALLCVVQGPTAVAPWMLEVVVGISSQSCVQ